MPLKESVGSVGNGAIVAGLALACVALPCWFKSRYYREHVKAKLIDQVQSVAISDLRSLLDSPTNATTTGRLIFVRGIVAAKSAIDGCYSENSSDDDPDYFLSLSGDKAVALRRIVLRFFSKDWKDSYLPVSELRTRVSEFHQKYFWLPFYKVPFILVEGGQKPFSDYIVVNMDVKDHLIPLETAYRAFEPVHRSTTDILRPSQHGFPVCLWVKDEILPLGRHISAVGICCYENGVPVISYCNDLPYFFTNCRSKDELVEEASSRIKLLFELSLFFGLLALGFFSYAAVRKWRTWKRLRK